MTTPQELKDRYYNPICNIGGVYVPREFIHGIIDQLMHKARLTAMGLDTISDAEKLMYQILSK